LRKTTKGSGQKFFRATKLEDAKGYLGMTPSNPERWRLQFDKIHKKD